MAAAIQVSRAHLARLSHHAGRLQHRLHRVSAKAEHAFDVGISSALAVATASGLGYVHGRHGAVEVAGVPMELAAGLLGTGAALFGVGGKHADKLGAIGSSMLGIYGYNTAKGAGLKMKKTAEDKVATSVKGRLPQDRLTSEEINTMDRPTVAATGA